MYIVKKLVLVTPTEGIFYVSDIYRNNSGGKVWKNVVMNGGKKWGKGLSPSSSKHDILTKTSFLTHLTIKKLSTMSPDIVTNPKVIINLLTQLMLIICTKIIF